MTELSEWEKFARDQFDAGYSAGYGAAIDDDIPAAVYHGEKGYQIGYEAGYAVGYGAAIRGES